MPSNLTQPRFFSCIPWQYCRTYGLNLSKSSTGVRGAAGKRQPAAKNPALYTVQNGNTIMAATNGETDAG